MFIVTPFALILWRKPVPMFTDTAYQYCRYLFGFSGAGIRYKGRLNPLIIFSVGGLGGLTGGLTGIPGPPLFFCTWPVHIQFP